MDNKNFGQDEYLPISDYQGRPASKLLKGFSSFEHKGGFYFALLDSAGNVFMRSEGYTTEKSRDNGIESVNKNKTLAERWVAIDEKGKFYASLKAGNHQEVARSGSYKSKGDAEAAIKAFLSGKAVSSSSGSAKAEAKGGTKKSSGSTSGYAVSATGLAGRPVISESRNFIGEKRNVIGETRGKAVEKGRKVIGEKRNIISSTKGKVKEDDYLKCEAYQGHKVTDTKNRVATFKGADGLFYFVAYYKDGTVRLRSEGSKTEAERTEALKTVVSHLENEKSYSTIKKGKYYINILKDKNGNEIGRSCMSTKPQEWVAWVAAAMTTTVVTTKKAVAEVIPPPKATLVAEEVAAGSGCMKWWWLPLLLLIPLLLWWVGCFAPPAVVAPVIAPVAVAAPPVVIPTCNCEDLTHPIFRIPDGPAPKTTTALGRAPEYGNSHALTPQQFYDKLNGKYQSSSMERTFLDGISKQLGFEGGWKDITPSIITAVNVPRGVSGNLGTKTTHKTVYRKLDPIDAKDLKAFRFAGKNACDLHFMKTCGNHFFFQECE